ncbi:10266_t:CDS:1, partial [Gigaspora rosea]
TVHTMEVQNVTSTDEVNLQNVISTDSATLSLILGSLLNNTTTATGSKTSSKNISAV